MQGVSRLRDYKCKDCLVGVTLMDTESKSAIARRMKQRGRSMDCGIELARLILES